MRPRESIDVLINMLVSLPGRILPPLRRAGKTSALRIRFGPRKSCLRCRSSRGCSGPTPTTYLVDGGLAVSVDVLAGPDR